MADEDPGAEAGVEAVDETDGDTKVALTPTESAEAAIRVGVVISAIRCVLTYVVVPIAGFAGLVLGPIGVVLQVFAALTCTSGARRLWKLKHRLRWPYAALAAVIDLMAVTSVLGLVGFGLASIR